MERIDIHTHSTYSSDGRSSLDDMAEAALAQGVDVFGVSEHFNYDYERMHLLLDGKEDVPIDEAGYFAHIRRLQKRYAGRMQVLAGAEFGFDHSSRAQERYARTAEKYCPDFIVNSVHTCLGGDCYFPSYCDGKSKEYAYNSYLYRVLESLDAAYPYDVVAHIGYCSRNATYPDPKLRYEEFADILDEILRRIVKKGKILEVNTNTKTAGSAFLPDSDILARYRELGGEKVSFASDAHDTARICDKFGLVCEKLASLGFSGLTVPCRGKHILYPFR